MAVPRTKLKSGAEVLSKKKLYRTILNNQKDLFKQLFELRKDISKVRKELKEEAVKCVEKELGDKIHMIDSTLKDVMVQRKIFIDKGYITREEVNEKYKELQEG